MFRSLKNAVKANFIGQVFPSLRWRQRYARTCFALHGRFLLNKEKTKYDQVIILKKSVIPLNFLKKSRVFSLELNGLHFWSVNVSFTIQKTDRMPESEKKNPKKEYSFIVFLCNISKHFNLLHKESKIIHN